MSRPHQHRFKPQRRLWFRRVASTLLVSSLLHSSSTALAQQTDLRDPAPNLNLTNQASVTFEDPAGNVYTEETENLESQGFDLIDPLGQILGCDGALLDDYTGFSVAVYNPDPSDPTGAELGSLLDTTRTEVPDISGNGIPEGLEPNDQNVNPFFLTNADEGRYNFLFDPDKGQLDIGRAFIIVVDPPANSTEFVARRIRIEILTSPDSPNTTDPSARVISYLASSLDGLPISTDGGTQLTDTVSLIPNAEQVSLELMALQFSTAMCEENQIQITKSADRAAAQPGDSVVYRIAIRNLSEVPMNNFRVTDILPTGFRFLEESVRASIQDQAVAVTADLSSDGSTAIFTTDTSVPSTEVLNIIYATQLTPDAIRSDGRNSAAANAQRTDNSFSFTDGPVTHVVRIDPGILSDCATLIGRVFVDKNFDGEQQPGEAGVPNAVIFLDDGNRIVTDADGLFSVTCLLPGRRTGVLDLSSLPGYTLAPNLYFRERNSQSRLVNVAPGSMVRMNFGVTPTFQEENQ